MDDDRLARRSARAASLHTIACEPTHRRLAEARWAAPGSAQIPALFAVARASGGGRRGAAPHARAIARAADRRRDGTCRELVARALGARVERCRGAGNDSRRVRGETKACRRENVGSHRTRRSAERGGVHSGRRSRVVERGQSSAGRVQLGRRHPVAGTSSPGHGTGRREGGERSRPSREARELATRALHRAGAASSRRAAEQSATGEPRPRGYTRSAGGSHRRSDAEPHRGPANALGSGSGRFRRGTRRTDGAMLGRAPAKRAIKRAPPRES